MHKSTEVKICPSFNYTIGVIREKWSAGQVLRNNSHLNIESFNVDCLQGRPLVGIHHPRTLSPQGTSQGLSRNIQGDQLKKDTSKISETIEFRLKCKGGT
jgi:hypothetical protein